MNKLDESLKAALDTHAATTVADSHHEELTGAFAGVKDELTNVRFASDNVRHSVGALYEAVANGAPIRKDRVGTGRQVVTDLQMLLAGSTIVVNGAGNPRSAHKRLCIRRQLQSVKHTGPTLGKDTGRVGNEAVNRQTLLTRNVLRTPYPAHQPTKIRIRVSEHSADAPNTAAIAKPAEIAKYQKSELRTISRPYGESLRGKVHNIAKMQKPTRKPAITNASMCYSNQGYSEPKSEKAVIWPSPKKPVLPPRHENRRKHTPKIGLWLAPVLDCFRATTVGYMQRSLLLGSVRCSRPVEGVACSAGHAV